MVGPATAAAVESFHSLINDENAPIIRVSRRTVQSARARLNERTQSNNGGWMQLNRRIPGNAGDTSYGGDWATTSGD